MQREILDIIARMIDPPVQVPEEDNSHSIRRAIRRRFVQLPWAIEYAIIQYVHGEQPNWFERFENPKLGNCTQDFDDPTGLTVDNDQNV